LLTIVALTATSGVAQASSVISPSVSLSSTAAGIPGVTYVTEFTTSAALAANSGKITAALPTGTVVPNQSVAIVDAASGGGIGGTSLPAFANGNATATWTVQQSIAAGRKLQIAIPGVTNAGAGAGQALISTSADTTSAGTPTFQLTNPQALAKPS